MAGYDRHLTVCVVGTDPRPLWPSREGVKVKVVERYSELHLEGAPLLVDFAAADIRGGTTVASIDMIEGIFAMGGSLLADPWRGTVPIRFFSNEYIEEGRIFIFAPLVYHPALLELKRVIGEELLGEIGGVDLTASAGFRRAELLYAVSQLFGVPSGWRLADFGAFLWYTRFGCRVTFDRSIASDASNADRLLTVKPACRRGLIEARVLSESGLRVMPAGNEQYALPLPEGDGIYYNRIDVIDSVCARSRAFPVAATVNAVRWVEECTHEGA